MTGESAGVRLIVALRNGFTQIVEELNAMLDELAPPETRSALGIPRIDLAELDQAGWESYKTKQPAQPGESAWLKNPVHFTSYEAPQSVLELVKALAKSPDKKLVLGDMEYGFSGQGKFITKRPAKKESAK